jgi:hypothetical protein
MTGANTVHSADSKSLWNYTLSPGWTPQEIEVFIAALKKYGVGRWTTITKNRFLPGKTVAQMYNQCQRLLGQQSVAEFEGLRIRLNEVFAANAKIKGVKRKNNCIVNEGDKQTREMVLAKKKYNQETYGITDEEADAIVIPVLKHEDTSSVFVDSADTEKATNPGQIRYEKIQRLKMLAKELKYVEGKIEEAKMSDESVDASVSSEEESDSEEESTSDEETSSEEESSGAEDEEKSEDDEAFEKPLGKRKAPAKTAAKQKKQTVIPLGKGRAKKPAHKKKPAAKKRKKTKEEEEAESLKLAMKLQMEEMNGGGDY